MAYSDFTVGKVKQAFGIQTNEGTTFFPTLSPVTPTSTLLEVLEENLPLAVALPSEKAKSELLISPILVEVRKLLLHQVSLVGIPREGDSYEIAFASQSSIRGDRTLTVTLNY